MLVSELIEELTKLPPTKPIIIMCQVIGGDDVWNMGFEVRDVPTSWMVVLAVSHPDLTSLPEINAS